MKRIVLFGMVLAVLMMWLPARAADEVAIQAAIDNGLVWLASQQNLTPGPDYGCWGELKKEGKTGLAVKKFEHDAVLRGYDNPFDPAYLYHDVVQRGLNYLFAGMSIHAIGIQPAGDPDTDGDGIGVALDGGDTYETGIGLMAVAETNTPGRVVDVPGSAVDGWTYYDVAVDIMNYLAWSQINTGTGRGAWGYDENSMMGDNSNSGYATLGLGFAQAAPPDGFGIIIPAFVKAELNFWIGYIQNPVDGDQFDGGSGYIAPDDTTAGYQTVNSLETGNLIYEMAFYGDDDSAQRLLDAIDYLVRHWGDPGYTWPGPQGWHGNYQAMFTVMKGLEAFQIDMIDGIDWFDEISDSIVGTQNMNGSWPTDVWDSWPGVGGDQVLSTTWALLTLQKVTPVLEIAVDLDIKPMSCPNPLNTKSKGVLPIAILGTEDFDASGVDPETVTLEGVSPLRWAWEDVATPFEGDLCDCHELGPDGYMDLTLKFATQEIVAALGAVTDGEYRPLTLMGETFDGIPIYGQDCIWIKHKVKDPGPPPVISVGTFTGAVTTVHLSLGEATEVSMVVYDVRGKRVRTVINGTLPSGDHSIPWNGTDEADNPVSNGVYFCRVKAGSVEKTVKMLQLR